MKKIITAKYLVTTSSLSALFIGFPVIASAQTTNNLSDVAELVIRYFNLAIYFIMSLAILFFFWNVFKYFFSAGTDKSEAGMYVLYSIIGFVIMFTFWGIVAVVVNSLGLDNNPAGISTPIGGAVRTQTFIK